MSLRGFLLLCVGLRAPWVSLRRSQSPCLFARLREGTHGEIVVAQVFLSRRREYI